MYCLKRKEERREGEREEGRGGKASQNITVADYVFLRSFQSVKWGYFFLHWVIGKLRHDTRSDSISVK